MVFQIVSFLIVVKTSDRKHDFPDSAISTSGSGRTNVFLILVPSLIQILMLFLLHLRLFVRDLAFSIRQGVRWLWYWRVFFNEFVTRILSERGLELG